MMTEQRDIKTNPLGLSQVLAGNVLKCAIGKKMIGLQMVIAGGEVVGFLLCLFYKAGQIPHHWRWVPRQPVAQSVWLKRAT